MVDGFVAETRQTGKKSDRSGYDNSYLYYRYRKGKGNAGEGGDGVEKRRTIGGSVCRWQGCVRMAGYCGLGAMFVRKRHCRIVIVAPVQKKIADNLPVSVY